MQEVECQTEDCVQGEHFNTEAETESYLVSIIPCYNSVLSVYLCICVCICHTKDDLLGLKLVSRFVC